MTDFADRLDLSSVSVHECWVSRDWRGRKTMQMGCTCSWDDAGNPDSQDGSHFAYCPHAGAHRPTCDGTCDASRQRQEGGGS